MKNQIPTFETGESIDYCQEYFGCTAAEVEKAEGQETKPEHCEGCTVCKDPCSRENGWNMPWQPVKQN